MAPHVAKAALKPIAAQRVPSGEMRVVRARIGVVERMRRIYRYRELLTGMVRKELKVKYKNSVLGFAWSLLNPLMILVVYYFAFQVILGAGLPQFPLFLLTGVLVWNLFSGAVLGATVSIVANAALVKKVSFPREIIPLASIGAALVHFCLQGTVLIAALAGFRHGVNWRYVPLLVPGLIVIVIVSAGLGILLSAVNAYLRDTQHFLELALVAWFWASPIVYAYGLVTTHLQHTWARVIYLANPVTPVVLTFQRALYRTTDFVTFDDKLNPHKATVHAILPHWSVVRHVEMLGIGFVFAGALFVVAVRVFGRLEGNIAEEL